VDGGGGVDTLKLDGAGLTLDLTKISNTRIQDIEKISSLLVPVSVLAFLSPKWSMAYLELPPSFAKSGDVNGDGLDDLIVGAWGAPSGQSTAGKSYVVFGKTNGSAVDLSTIADASNPLGGFVINGEAAFDESGFSVSSAGDVNGDGLDDLIVGAMYADPNGNSSGKSYIVFGKANNNAINLSDIANASDPTGGSVLVPAAMADNSMALVLSCLPKMTYDLPANDLLL
jgi:hypothetical protein